MTNRNFIITLILIICTGTIATGMLLYSKQHKTVANVEQVITEQNSIPEHIQEPESKETWEKIGEHLYFDVNSIKGNRGIFKIYYTSDNAPDYYDTIPALGIQKVSCDCKEGYMYIEQTEYFDENNKYIAGDYPRAFADISYKEYENGEIYLNTLCKSFNN